MNESIVTTRTFPRRYFGATEQLCLDNETVFRDG